MALDLLRLFFNDLLILVDLFGWVWGIQLLLDEWYVTSSRLHYYLRHWLHGALISPVWPFDGLLRYVAVALDVQKAWRWAIWKSACRAFQSLCLFLVSICICNIRHLRFSHIWCPFAAMGKDFLSMLLSLNFDCLSKLLFHKILFYRFRVQLTVVCIPFQGWCTWGLINRAEILA